MGKAFGDFNCSFTASAVGLSCESFTARDLFKGIDLGTYKGGFWREVDESSIVLLKLKCSELDDVDDRSAKAAKEPTGDRGML